MGKSSSKWENYVLTRGMKVLVKVKEIEQTHENKLKLIFCLLLFSFAVKSYGQVTMNSPAKTVQEDKKTLPFKDRWGFKTNAVDWILLLPNITAEFDLFNSPYKHYTVSLGVKGNWNSSQNYVPDIIYNLLDVRSEFRCYHRTAPRSYQRPDSLKISLFKRLKEDVFTWKHFHPRYWRAYYIGAYVDACNYTLKFGKEGRQGTAYGLGVSGGFGIPLYAYKKNYLDLEFGASVGMVYTKYDVFQRNPDSNYYPVIESKHKDFHFLPYPVVSELRVAFVYRFASIKGKYTQIDEAKREARLERKRLQILAADSINEMRLKVRHERELQRDSLIKVKEAEKLQKSALKDSLEQIRLFEKQAEKAVKDSIRAAAKLEKEQGKKLEEEVKSDSIADQSLQTIVEKMQTDSIPAKIEIIPIEEVPEKTDVKNDTLQMNDPLSSDSIKAEALLKRVSQEVEVTNMYSVLASIDLSEKQQPKQTLPYLQSFVCVRSLTEIKEKGATNEKFV